MRCVTICNKPRLFRSWHIFHFTCIRCANRRALSGKLPARIHWNKLLKAWMPTKYHQLCLIEVENNRPYVLVVDDERFLRAIKDVLLTKLFSLASKANEKGNTRTRKKYLTLCENLAS